MSNPAAAPAAAGEPAPRDPAPGDLGTDTDWFADLAPGPQPQSPAPRARKRRWRSVALVAIASALFLAAAVAVGEWAGTTAEMNALVGEIEESEAAMVTVMADVADTLGAPTLQDTDEQFAQLRQAALEAQGQVAASADRISAQPIAPWHPEVEAARDAYLAHSQAWQDYLGKVAQDPSGWLTPDEDIETTWDALDPLLRAAVPTPAALDLDGRVERILADSSADEPGETLQAAGAPSATAVLLPQG